MITLTNEVQVPENAVQLQTTAAIDGYYVTQPLRLVQYDETLPVAAVQLTYQSQPYIPPTGAELNVRMNKPDGKGVYNPCLGVDSSGIVYFVFTQQMTAAAGDGKLTIEVTDSGVKNSAPIAVNVAENPVQEGSIESADEFLTLQEILAEAEKWGQIVQANADNIQQVVDNLTDIQNAAENAQAAAASAAAAQQAAQEALGFRKFYSAVVPDANGNLDPSRPMVVGPAASVEIESAGDRIQSVTALGFTQQAGTGDPSPTNVRAITNGGLRMVKVVFDGTENWVPAASTPGADPAFAIEKVPMPKSGTNEIIAAKTQFCTDCPIKNSDGYSGECIWVYGTGSDSGIRARLFRAQSANELKKVLADRYAAGNPVIVWYVPSDESDATGLYAPIILQGGEYRATCLPLTAPLCEEDSVVSRAENADGDAESVETHVQSVVVADGSTTALTQGSGGYTLALPGATNGAVKCDTFSNLTASSGSVTIPASQFPSSVTSLETANQWLQSNNVTVVYPLATPAVYTHDPVALEAATGDQLTYTVTGQSGGTVSVSLKPFQDGGHAKTADSATTAQNATEFDGHAWSEVPRQAPVQSVNSKTGAVTLSAADVKARPDSWTPTAAEVGAIPKDNAKTLASGITWGSGSTLTPEGWDDYAIIQLSSNYGRAIIRRLPKNGSTFALFASNTADYINITCVTVTRGSTGGSLSLSIITSLRLSTSGITKNVTEFNIYQIDGLV